MEPKFILTKKAQPFVCHTCDFKCSRKYDFDRHLSTRKHEILTKYLPDLPKTRPQEFTCECGKVYKHKQSLNNHKLKCLKTLKSKYPPEFACECGKVYKHKQSLNNHRLKCVKITQKSPDEKYQNLQKELNEFKNTFGTVVDCMKTQVGQVGTVVDCMKTQSDQMMGCMKTQSDQMMGCIKTQNDQMINQSNQIIEMSKNTGINNTINNNQKININLFLNENCKDAMNMQMFLEQIKLTINDLLHSKDYGNVDTITKVIVDNLNELDVEERPVHCTNLKNGTLYIKDGDSWKKEAGKEKPRMEDLIRRIGHRHANQVKAWCDSHPNWQDNPILSDQYHSLVKQIYIDENAEKKIIRNISKEVQLNNEIVKS